VFISFDTSVFVQRAKNGYKVNSFNATMSLAEGQESQTSVIYNKLLLIIIISDLQKAVAYQILFDDDPSVLPAETKLTWPTLLGRTMP